MKEFHAYARLGRADDKLPWGHRLFGQGSDFAGYEIVDPRDVQTAALLRDGSIVLEEPKEVRDQGSEVRQEKAASETPAPGSHA